MEYSKKIQEYKVSIRRRHVNQKLANLRVKSQSTTIESSDVQAVVKQITSIFENSTMEQLYGKMDYMRKYSQNAQVAKVLKDYFQGFYRLLLQVDNHFQGKQSEADELYCTICTILINIVSLEEIDFSQDINQDIATPIINNIKTKTRETDTLWLIANILYRRNRLAKHFLQMLLKNNLAEFVRKRVDFSFQNESSATIFYYFVGAVIANLDSVESFNQLKSLLKVVGYLSELQIEECYLYILDGLALYAYSFGKHSYEVFTTSIFKKCEGYCISKKTRFVKKYLEVIVKFLTGETNQLYNVPEEARKKLIAQQYQRCRKYGLLKHMEFCLENRSPQVKKLLLQASCTLIAVYFSEIDLSMEYFYLTLAEEIRNIDKYDQKVTLPLLKYMEILTIALLKVGNVNKHSDYAEAFLKFVESNLLFEKIEFVLRHYSQNLQILNLCFDIIAYLQQYNIPSLVEALMKTNLISALQYLEINQADLSKKRDILIDYIKSQDESRLISI